VFENRLLSKIFGPMREEITGGMEDYVMTTVIVCTVYPSVTGKAVVPR
jgi:hypothetical protein